MTMPLILRKTPRGFCRICKDVFYDTDSDRVIADHNRTCAQAHYEKHKEHGDPLAFLDSQDPELQAHVEREYKAGRLKPSTERVT
jgi:hypothetical protein